MKLFLMLTLLLSLIAACNNAENKSTTEHNQPQTHEDSLLKDVMNGHDVAMGKMNRVSALQKKVQAAIDSINKLPGKLKKSTIEYKLQLDSLSQQLKFADNSMNKWMEEFNYDTATISANRAIYLEAEKKKITAVKDTLLAALEKADYFFKK